LTFGQFWLSGLSTYRPTSLASNPIVTNPILELWAKCVKIRTPNKHQWARHFISIGFQSGHRAHRQYEEKAFRANAHRPVYALADITPSHRCAEVGHKPLGLCPYTMLLYCLREFSTVFNLPTRLYRQDT